MALEEHAASTQFIYIYIYIYIDWGSKNVKTLRSMAPLSSLLRHLSSPHESILIGIHVTSIIHSYFLVKKWNKFGDAFPRYFHGKWTLQIETLPYLILKLKVYIQLRYKSCYEFFKNKRGEGSWKEQIFYEHEQIIINFIFIFGEIGRTYAWGHHSKVNVHGRKCKDKVDNMTLTCPNCTKKINFS